MSDPSFRPLNLGNTADDDATVIDSLVEQNAEPPTPVVEPIVTPSLPSPKIPTRLLSGRQMVNPEWANATLVVPADTLRKRLRVEASSPSTAATGSRITPETVTVSNLTAGVNTFTVTVPDDETWELLAVRYTVATGAAVADRMPEVTIRDASAVDMVTVSSTAVITASTSRTFNWFTGGSGADGVGNLSMPLPNGVIVGEGGSIVGSVFNFQAADTITNIAITVRKSSVTPDSVALMSSSGTSTGLALLADGQGVDLDGHTGAVFAAATGSAPVYVNYWSVTE